MVKNNKRTRKWIRAYMPKDTPFVPTEVIGAILDRGKKSVPTKSCVVGVLMRMNDVVALDSGEYKITG